MTYRSGLVMPAGSTGSTPYDAEEAEAPRLNTHLLSDEYDVGHAHTFHHHWPDDLECSQLAVVTLLPLL